MTTDRAGRRAQQGWQLAEWCLFAGWVLAALYDMYPTLPGGRLLVGSFLTTHAADLALPAWLYITIRRRPSRVALKRIVGRSRGTTALLIFIASVLTELSQILWPNGLFRGTFDPLDLLAYAAGLAVCYFMDGRYPIIRDDPVRGRETPGV